MAGPPRDAYSAVCEAADAEAEEGGAIVNDKPEALTTEKIAAYIICLGVDPTIGATGCGSVGLTTEQYERQMSYPDARWRCPRCRGDAEFDDEKSEQLWGVV